MGADREQPGGSGENRPGGAGHPGDADLGDDAGDALGLDPEPGRPEAYPPEVEEGWEQTPQADGEAPTG